MGDSPVLITNFSHIIGDRSRITVNFKEINLGTFSTALEAALVYDNYILVNNLEHTLNFPPACRITRAGASHGTIYGAFL